MAAVSIATLALAGCGSKTVKIEGTNRIGQCPADYIHKGDKPIRSLPQAEQDLGSAVTQLSAKLPLDEAGEPVTRFANGATPVDTAIWTVAYEVFSTEEGMYSDTEFAIDQPNKIDTPSEQFCRQGAATYLSPQARNIVGGFVELGIHVGSLTQ
ncbi:MAG TPA: hypothetical protein VK712_02400 [Verrucomicrobiae bacterium]|nr:hypothetical protein [Verrucomicrobiae bacterium]